MNDFVTAFRERVDITTREPGMASQQLHSVEGLMAGSVPVVATHVHGTRELIVDGETGRLVPPAEAGPLADALRSLLHAPDRMQAMGQQGRRRVEAHFSLEAMVRKNEELYDLLLAKKGRRARRPRG